MSVRASPLSVCSLIAAAGLLVATRAHALEDPTRPPAGSGRAAPSRAQPADLILQSVIISDTRRAALINGELVQLGGRVGTARLVKVSESEVELLTGAARRTLALYPGVDKRRAGGGQQQQINEAINRHGDER